MRFQPLASVICLLGLATAAEYANQRRTVCTVTAKATPPENRICNEPGRVSKRNPMISEIYYVELDDCAYECYFDTEHCASFSFTQPNDTFSLCHLYGKRLEHNFHHHSASEFAFYDRACYERKCPSDCHVPANAPASMSFTPGSLDSAASPSPLVALKNGINAYFEDNGNFAVYNETCGGEAHIVCQTATGGSPGTCVYNRFDYCNAYFDTTGDFSLIQFGDSPYYDAGVQGSSMVFTNAYPWIQILDGSGNPLWSCPNASPY